MENILFLTHRIPYPPNKGDKVRSFNILRWLNKNYNVYLGCFIDNPEDIKYKNELSNHSSDFLCLYQPVYLSLARSVVALCVNQPITTHYYYSRKMERWVKDIVVKHKIKKVLIFSSSMARYVTALEFEKVKRVIDFVDVDSDKWRQYSLSSKTPLAWIYSREYKLLSVYEKYITSLFDAAFFVSESESKLFCENLNKDLQHKVSVIENGVDAEYFSPKREASNKESTAPIIVFTGTMDYKANVNAVTWFVKYVFPLIQKKDPSIKFYIVGRNPLREVKKLGEQANVVVTGMVEDIRPYLEKASIVVAPIRMSRGVQNKILEAMSMAKFLVATPMAMKGIELEKEKVDVTTADSPEEYAKNCLLSIDKYSKTMAQSLNNRKFVEKNYNWQRNLSSLKSMMN